MKSEDFVHLHNHSTYSLLEALPSPEEIVLRAKELGLDSAFVKKIFTNVVAHSRNLQRSQS